jgi:hypothetical protein
VTEARVEHIKEKVATVKQQMRHLKQIGKQMSQAPDGQVSLTESKIAKNPVNIRLSARLAGVLGRSRKASERGVWCRLRDYSALTRLAPSGPPSKTPAFNFAWRRSCRTPLVVCRGFEWTTSSGRNLARFSEILVGFAG